MVAALATTIVVPATVAKVADAAAKRFLTKVGSGLDSPSPGNEMKDRTCQPPTGYRSFPNG